MPDDHDGGPTRRTKANLMRTDPYIHVVALSAICLDEKLDLVGRSGIAMTLGGVAILSLHT